MGKSTVHTRKNKVVGPSLEATLARPQFSSSAPLSVSHPELSKEWHREKNFFTPDDYTFGSNEKVWWLCQKGPDHVWKASICERTGNKTGCPYCDGKEVSVTNSLKSLYPKVAREWHGAKNGNITPADVTAQANKSFFWQCAKSPHHIWKARVANRTTRGSGCPYCAGKIASRENNLRSTHPAIAKEWHASKNGILKPSEVTEKSAKSVWWQCKRVPEHEWQTKIQTRTNYKTGCPFCACKKVSKTNSLACLLPDLARDWHPQKNGKLTANDVTRGSTKRVFWQCSKDSSHEWETTVGSRGVGKSGCPHCYKLDRSKA